MCRLKKALHGIKKAPKTWHSILDKYLQQQGFTSGSTDTNPYIKYENYNFLNAIFYVDDIIFSSHANLLNQKCVFDMKKS